MGLIIHFEPWLHREIDWNWLQQLPEAWYVADIGQLLPGRSGRALPLRLLLEHLVPAHIEITGLILQSERDGFSKRISYAPVRDHAWLVFELHEAPLPESLGGPFRLLVKGTVPCGRAELDHCVNVKHLSRIDLQTSPDTFRAGP
ncbi:MAG: hypothetical protein R3C12_11725 [Planctomycetaceae bacterium]|nr:molybdopterin-dependent oxidoreductase [Planctomycetaceae bacterium]